MCDDSTDDHTLILHFISHVMFQYMCTFVCVCKCVYVCACTHTVYTLSHTVHYTTNNYSHSTLIISLKNLTLFYTTTSNFTTFFLSHLIYTCMSVCAVCDTPPLSLCFHLLCSHNCNCRGDPKELDCHHIRCVINLLTSSVTTFYN